MLYSLDVSVVDEADVIMKKLRNSFETAAADDKSGSAYGQCAEGLCGHDLWKGQAHRELYKR